MATFNSEFDFYKLKHWVNPKQINWNQLVTKKNTILFIEKYIDILNNGNLQQLSKNPFAVEMLKRNINKISWNDFVNNPNCIHVIEENIDICFDSLDNNGKIGLLSHPNFIHIVKKNENIIIDKLFCSNILGFIALQKKSIYMDLLEKYLNKYPDKKPVKEASYFWNYLSENPFAISLIENNMDKLNENSWNILAGNYNAIHIIENNLFRLNSQGWRNLSENHKAISILEKNFDNINWFNLSYNINGYQIFQSFPDKISSYSFLDYENISINDCIFEVDYENISKRCSLYKEELLSTALHPSRIEAYFNQGISIEDLDKYI
jgi:hypothetical protein